MTSLTAPKILGSRQRAIDFVTGLPKDLTGDAVEIVLREDSRTSTSFLDQVCAEILLERNAAKLIFKDATDYAREIINKSGAHFQVLDRIEFH